MSSRIVATGARQTTVTYDDANRRVTVSSDRLSFQGGEKLVQIHDFDQFGQIYLSRSNDDTHMPTVGDTYGISVKAGDRIANLARYALSSVPYAAGESESTMGWQRKKFDTEGRLREMETFSGSVLPSPWVPNSTAPSLGKTTYTYAGNQTTIVDPAGRSTVLTVDALGRLKNSTQGVNSADYTYNHFDSVETVFQIDGANYGIPKFQTRSFCGPQ